MTSPGLKRIVVRNDREELRDDIGRTIHHHAQGERHDRDAGELSIEQELQLQDWLACLHLSVDQRGKADDCDDREPANERGFKPFLAVALLEDDRQSAQPQDEPDNARPIRVGEIFPLWLFVGQANEQQAAAAVPQTGTLTKKA